MIVHLVTLNSSDFLYQCHPCLNYEFNIFCGVERAEESERERGRKVFATICLMMPRGLIQRCGGLIYHKFMNGPKAEACLPG